MDEIDKVNNRVQELEKVILTLMVWYRQAHKTATPECVRDVLNAFDEFEKLHIKIKGEK